MRLTNKIKESIVQAAIKKAGLHDRELQLKPRYAAFAEKVRLSVVTDEQLKLISQCTELLKKVDDSLLITNYLFRKEEYLFLNAAGTRRRFWWCGSQTHSNAVSSEKRISPYEAILKADSALMIELNSIDADEEAIKKEKEHLIASLYAVLDSVTTDKKLYEVWPEAVYFVPTAERAATQNLPALHINELNKVIGLP